MAELKPFVSLINCITMNCTKEERNRTYLTIGTLCSVETVERYYLVKLGTVGNSCLNKEI